MSRSRELHNWKKGYDTLVAEEGPNRQTADRHLKRGERTQEDGELEFDLLDPVLTNSSSSLPDRAKVWSMANGGA
jgi:hypothetical protein